MLCYATTKACDDSRGSRQLFARLITVGDYRPPAPVLGQDPAIAPKSAHWVDLFGDRSEWHVDVELQAAFRRYHEVHGRAYEPLDAVSTCCYSKCTPLNSSSFAGEKAEEPQGQSFAFQRDELCVPAPEAGTQFPKLGNHLCPTAILFEAGAWPSGVARPFRSMKGSDRCCYAHEEPRP